MPRNTPGKNRPLYFLHIPKTAGTSFTLILDSIIDAKRTLPQKVWNDFASLESISFKNFDFIRGHFGYGVHKHTTRKINQITMLRDPVERTVSQVNHIIVDGQASNWVFENYYQGESFDQLVMDETKNKVFSNLQTRYVANRTDVIRHLESRGLAPAEFRFDILLTERATIIHKFTGVITALSRLSKMEFIGIQEKFEESLLLLCYKFNLERPTEIPYSMMKPGRPKTTKLEKRVIQKIKKLNKYDRILYWWGKKLFEMSYKKMLRELSNNTLEDIDLDDKEVLWHHVTLKTSQAKG